MDLLSLCHLIVEWKNGQDNGKKINIWSKFQKIKYYLLNRRMLMRHPKNYNNIVNVVM